MNEKTRILFFRYSMYPGAGLGIDNQWSTIVPLQLVMNLGDVINLDVTRLSVTVSHQCYSRGTPISVTVYFCHLSVTVDG